MRWWRCWHTHNPVPPSHRLNLFCLLCLLSLPLPVCSLFTSSPLPPLSSCSSVFTFTHRLVVCFALFSEISISCQTLAASVSIRSWAEDQASSDVPSHWQRMSRELHKQLLLYFKAGCVCGGRSRVSVPKTAEGGRAKGWCQQKQFWRDSVC